MFIYPGKTDRDPSETRFRAENATYMLDTINPLTWIATARKVIASRPDVLLIPWWTSFMAPSFFSVSWMVAARAGIPTVFLCHNVIEHDSNLLKRVLARIAFQRPSAFLCQSDDDLEYLRQHRPDAIVKKVFHPTYSVLVNSPGSSPIRRQPRSKGRYPSGGVPRLLFFGYVKRYKGLDILIRAMKRIREVTGATLDVVGEVFGKADHYRRLIDRLGMQDIIHCDFRYVGNEELGRLFGHADLVVLPYIKATGSGVLQLALDFGKPVVASAIGEISDKVEDGVNGILVEPGHVPDLERGVLQALHPGTLECLARGARESGNEYSWEKYVSVVRRALSDVIEGSGGTN